MVQHEGRNGHRTRGPERDAAVCLRAARERRSSVSTLLQAARPPAAPAAARSATRRRLDRGAPGSPCRATGPARARRQRQRRGSDRSSRAQRRSRPPRLRRCLPVVLSFVGGAATSACNGRSWRGNNIANGGSKIGFFVIFLFVILFLDLVFVIVPPFFNYLRNSIE